MLLKSDLKTKVFAGLNGAAPSVVLPPDVPGQAVPQAVGSRSACASQESENDWVSAGAGMSSAIAVRELVQPRDRHSLEREDRWK